MAADSEHVVFCWSYFTMASIFSELENEAISRRKGGVEGWRVWGAEKSLRSATVLNGGLLWKDRSPQPEAPSVVGICGFTWAGILKVSSARGVGKRHEQMGWPRLGVKEGKQRNWVKDSGRSNWPDEPWTIKEVGERRRSESRCSQLLLTEERVRQEKMASDGIISEQEQFWCYSTRVQPREGAVDFKKRSEGDWK